MSQTWTLSKSLRATEGHAAQGPMFSVVNVALILLPINFSGDQSPAPELGLDIILI